MREIWTIARYSLLRQIRDYKAVAAFILLPIALILILGTALDSDFTPRTVEPAKVGFYSEDNGQLADALKQYLGSEELHTLLRIETAETLDGAKRNVTAGEWSGLIHLPREASELLRQGGRAQVQLYVLSERNPLRPLVESFVQTMNLQAAVTELQETPALAAPVSAEPIVTPVKIATAGKIPRGIDYYAVTTLFQCLIFGAMFGMFAITKDLGNQTHRRLFAAPVHPVQITLGKLIGTTAVLYAISLLLWVVTRYGFGANWNGSLWNILLVLLLFCLTAVSLGMLLGSLTRNAMVSSLAIFFLGTVFTLVAGGFSPMEGAVFDWLGRLSPNSYGQRALFSDIYEDSVAASSLGGLSVYAAVATGLALIAGRRRAA